MEQNISRKKLFKMALFTSTAIGVLVVEPLYITMLTIIPGLTKIIPFSNFGPFNSTFILFLTVAVWFVADLEAIPYQTTTNFDKRENLETASTPAINHTACCALLFF